MQFNTQKLRVMSLAQGGELKGKLAGSLKELPWKMSTKN